jgi:ATP-binding cassette subfamily B protein
LPYSLQGVSLRIKRGERVGVIGSTGYGKSTFVDLLMGLLMPTDGGIFIDGKLLDRGNLLSWQKNIAHVPQSIYLTDATIEENIAFNIPKHLINHNRVISAARQAQIATFIEQLPNQYETKVGERGVRLSGGQRQRIGIARALYKDVSLIVFDEATSALDEKTESAIIESINSLNSNLTLLIISHRMSTLRICNRFLEVKNSSITEIYR